MYTHHQCQSTDEDDDHRGIILSNISNLFPGDSFFESFNLSIKWLEIGLKSVSTKVEATANTGPANDPRPTSSTPIEILFII